MKHLSGGWRLEAGASAQLERKGAHGQNAGIQTTCPKMSIMGKTISIRGNQKELPTGGSGPGMEEVGEGAEFFQQEGALAQLSSR